MPRQRTSRRSSMGLKEEALAHSRILRSEQKDAWIQYTRYRLFYVGRHWNHEPTPDEFEAAAVMDYEAVKRVVDEASAL
jgi:hypothetical protein